MASVVNIDLIQPLLTPHGLTARFVAAADCSEDSELQLWRGDVDTRIAVQIGEAEETRGFYFVTEHGGEGDQLWSRGWGEFRSLRKALTRAIEKAKP